MLQVFKIGTSCQCNLWILAKCQTSHGWDLTSRQESATCSLQSLGPLSVNAQLMLTGTALESAIKVSHLGITDPTLPLEFPLNDLCHDHWHKPWHCDLKFSSIMNETIMIICEFYISCVVWCISVIYMPHDNSLWSNIMGNQPPSPRKDQRLATHATTGNPRESTAYRNKVQSVDGHYLMTVILAVISECRTPQDFCLCLPWHDLGLSIKWHARQCRLNVAPNNHYRDPSSYTQGPSILIQNITCADWIVLKWKAHQDNRALKVIGQAPQANQEVSHRKLMGFYRMCHHFEIILNLLPLHTNL